MTGGANERIPAEFFRRTAIRGCVPSYVFDSCRIITRTYLLPEQQDVVMFGHDVHDPVHPGQCLTGWEILRPV
jgi:hypothetical protein